MQCPSERASMGKSTKTETGAQPPSENGNLSLHRDTQAISGHIDRQRCRGTAKLSIVRDSALIDHQIYYETAANQ